MKASKSFIGGPLFLLLIMMIAIPGLSAASINHVDHGLFEPPTFPDNNIATFNNLDHGPSKPLPFMMKMNTSTTKIEDMDVRRRTTSGTPQTVRKRWKSSSTS